MRTFAIAVAVLMIMGLAASRRVASAPPATPEFLYTVAKRYEPLAWMNGSERFPAGAAVYVSGVSGRPSLVPNFAASADAAVSFDAKSVLFAGKHTVGEHWQIWELTLDGSDPRQVTNCTDDCVRPFYLPGDTIVYAEKVSSRFVIQSLERTPGAKPLALTYSPVSSFPTDVLRDGRILFESTFAGTTTPEIYTVYADGSGVESYRCDHGKARHSGRQLESGDIVFDTDSGLARFTSAVAHEVETASPTGQHVGDVAESPAGDWLLSSRPGASSDFQLKWWKPGQTAIRLAIAEPGAQLIQPALLAAHAVPKQHPSGLHDWQFGNLLCLNAYTSKYRFAADSIRSVRVYTQDAAGAAQLLGTAPVESDGSFFVQVPGDQPLQIELLDNAGKTLKRESGWFWMRKGEQRVCVGCHAGPETAPENAVPLVLTKSTNPADMTGAKSPGGGHQ